MPSRPVALATFKDLMQDNSSSCFIREILNFTSAGTLLFTYSVNVSLSKSTPIDAFSALSLTLIAEKKTLSFSIIS